MQKKIIALAVAGLVSGAAFAQSNVTVYGIADVGFQYSSDALVGPAKSQSAIIDGGQDGSRVGFKGSEDLGNGLSATFQLETRFHLDSFSAIEGRKSNVGLTGKWGSVILGSFGSVHDDINGYSESGGMGFGNGTIGMLVTDDTRNGVEYISPDFNGLTFKAGASTQYKTNNDDVIPVGAGDSAKNTRAVFGLVSYVNGLLQVAASYDRSKGQTTDTTSFNRDTEWLLAAGYDFGMFKLGAGYDKATFGDGNNAFDSRYVWRVTAGMPIGAADAVALSYNRTKAEVAAGGTQKASGWGVSYSHVLSKRTNVYATYGALSQDDDNVNPVNLGVTDGNTYQKAFKVGMRHFF